MLKTSCIVAYEIVVSCGKPSSWCIVFLSMVALLTTYGGNRRLRGSPIILKAVAMGIYREKD